MKFDIKPTRLDDPSFDITITITRTELIKLSEELGQAKMTVLNSEEILSQISQYLVSESYKAYHG